MLSLLTCRALVRTLCFIIVIFVAMGEVCVYADSRPWYRKLWDRVVIEDEREVDSGNREGQNRLEVKENGTGVGNNSERGSDHDSAYDGPDRSDQRTIEDDLLDREFPVLPKQNPEPKKNPPSADQYKVPDSKA